MGGHILLAIVHPGRCDQDKGCGCPKVCPFDAWYRDEKDENWLIDASKCTGCGLCLRECPAGAVLLANTLDEAERIKDGIDTDTFHTQKRLFVERYGGMPIKSEITGEEFDSKIKNDFVIVEFFRNEKLICMVKCVPYSEIMPCENIHKIDADKHPEITKQFNITQFPSLLFFRDGKIVGRIEGFKNDLDELREHIKKLA